MKKTRRKNRKGFSLAEALMATVVLGIAASAVLLPFVRGVRVRAEGTRRTMAAKLAGDLMEQIVKTPFTSIVASYNGYTEGQGQIKDAKGAIFTDSNYSKFGRDASCEYVYVPQENGNSAAKFIRATIRVYYDGGEVASIRRLITK